MEGCIAPSEVPGITISESSVFGSIAEDLIYADFSASRGGFFDMYVDNNNLDSYLFFLKTRNPHLNLKNFSGTLVSSELGMLRPDFLLHSSTERVFYEVKPNSVSGIRAGVTKVGSLSATYIHFKLPYTPGLNYTSREIIVASVPGQLSVKLKTQLKGPGLIVYQLCLNSSGLVELATLAAILRYVIKQMNKQARSKNFKPIDLQPAFAREGELMSLGKALGIVVAAGAATVGWKYFWKAVMKRFATRASTAAVLAAADGPLPVGELLAAGMSIWTVVDIIRLYDELWSDAATLAKVKA